jgi:hypothetical protein
MALESATVVNSVKIFFIFWSPVAYAALEFFKMKINKNEKYKSPMWYMEYVCLENWNVFALNIGTVGYATTNECYNEQL